MIVAVQTEAEQSPSDGQRKLLAAAKLLADATARMVEAARQCASSPQVPAGTSSKPTLYFQLLPCRHLYSLSKCLVQFIHFFLFAISILHASIKLLSKILAYILVFKDLKQTLWYYYIQSVTISPVFPLQIIEL